jgi:hypothetical protein
VKRGRDGNRGNQDAQKPTKNRAVLHKLVPVRFAGGYFECAV